MAGIALVPGELANVDAQGRVAIPAAVAKGVVWWSGEAIRVCAELTRIGLVRVFPSSAVAAALGAQSGSEFTAEADYVALAARTDRYRILTLYGAERRIRLSKEVCPWLGFNLGEPAVLYAQAFPFGVELMTMEHRFGRLSAVEADALPWTFNPP